MYKFKIDEKLNPYVDGCWVEINPYSSRRIWIKNANHIIAEINIPKEIDIRTIEISFIRTESDSLSDQDTLKVEVACMLNESDYYAILTGYATTKYDDEVIIKIQKTIFDKEEVIDIDI